MVKRLRRKFQEHWKYTLQSQQHTCSSSCTAVILKATTACHCYHTIEVPLLTACIAVDHKHLLNVKADIDELVVSTDTMSTPRPTRTAAAAAGAEAAAQADCKIVCRAVSCSNSSSNALNDNSRSSRSSRQQQQRRDALIRLITSRLGGMPGCSSRGSSLSEALAGEGLQH